VKLNLEQLEQYKVDWVTNNCTMKIKEIPNCMYTSRGALLKLGVWSTVYMHSLCCFCQGNWFHTVVSKISLQLKITILYCNSLQNVHEILSWSVSVGFSEYYNVFMQCFF